MHAPEALAAAPEMPGGCARVAACVARRGEHRAPGASVLWLPVLRSASMHVGVRGTLVA